MVDPGSSAAGGGAGRGGVALRQAFTLARAAVTPARRPKLPASPPLVSVVIATYNWSSVLRFAIASVISQDYPRWELIVVGDACTDDSEAVVASFADPRIRWQNRTENHGSQSFPNNDGIALANGEFVAYLGHDDVWTPDHLSRLVCTAIDKGVDVAFALTEMIGPPGSGLRTLSGMTPAGGYAGGHLPPSALLHRTAMAAEIGGWRDYREIYDAPDVDFTERALAAGNSFACTWTLSVFKPPSALRPNSYVDRRSGEQAALARRLESERLFRLRALFGIAWSRLRSSKADRSRGLGLVVTGDERGARVKAARRIRGLD